jgi:ABC-type uncharacterized transport system substrate-binding protein
VAGFVDSLARPGGNLTGVSQLRIAVAAKRLQMLHQIVPAAALIGVLVNPAVRPYTQEMNELEPASRILGVHLATANASKGDDIEPAIGALVAQGVGALAVTASSLFTGNYARIIALAARHRLPASLLADDLRFRSGADRMAHLKELEAELGARFRTKPAQYWLEALEEKGVPWVPFTTCCKPSAVF